MSRFRTILLSAIVAGAFAVPHVAAGEAGASTDPVQALKVECAMKGGTVFETPFDLVRCQSARSNKGFEVERLLCESAVDGGTLLVTPIASKHNRSSWGCFDF
jgi:hypothetical protein